MINLKLQLMETGETKQFDCFQLVFTNVSCNKLFEALQIKFLQLVVLKLQLFEAGEVDKLNCFKIIFTDVGALFQI